MPGGSTLEWWNSTSSPTDIARMCARAKKLRTPLHGSTRTRSRSAIENVSGSDFISQCFIRSRSSTGHRHADVERVHRDVTRCSMHLVGEPREVDVERKLRRLVERHEEV